MTLFRPDRVGARNDGPDVVGIFPVKGLFLYDLFSIRFRTSNVDVLVCIYFRILEGMVKRILLSLRPWPRLWLGVGARCRWLERKTSTVDLIGERVFLKKKSLGTFDKNVVHAKESAAVLNTPVNIFSGRHFSKTQELGSKNTVSSKSTNWF